MLLLKFVIVSFIYTYDMHIIVEMSVETCIKMPLGFSYLSEVK